MHVNLETRIKRDEEMIQNTLRSQLVNSSVLWGAIILLAGIGAAVLWLRP